MFGTVVTYILIFLSIRTKSRTRLNADFPNEDGNDPAAMKRAAKYMIIYPVVYVVCTLPLAGGRMASMTGMKIPYCPSKSQSPRLLLITDCARVVLSCWRSNLFLWLARRFALRRYQTCSNIQSSTSASPRPRFRHFRLEGCRRYLLGYEDDNYWTFRRSKHTPTGQAGFPWTENITSNIETVRRGSLCRPA